MEDTLFITLLRHGRSLADDEQVHEGRYDSPLTETGRRQLQQRADGWQVQGVRFDLIISSTLQRAKSSAQIIASTLEAPLAFDPDWMELDNGPLAGLPFDEAQRLYPQPAFRNPYQAVAGSGESGWQLYSRAAQAMENLLRRGPGAYLVVAHGGIINEALRTVCGAVPSPDRQGLWFALGDAGYVRLRYRPSLHQWTFLEMQPGV